MNCPQEIAFPFRACVENLGELAEKVIQIAICGQMHGILLWKDDKGHGPSLEPADHSPLHTWQDMRCSQEFLSQLERPDSHLRVATGYGCATLLW